MKTVEEVVVFEDKERKSILNPSIQSMLQHYDDHMTEIRKHARTWFEDREEMTLSLQLGDLKMVAKGSAPPNGRGNHSMKKSWSEEQLNRHGYEFG